MENISTFRRKPYKSNQKFYKKFFSPTEINYCLGKARSSAHFTGKFCAKEAIIKARQENNLFALANIEIINNKFGQPEALIKGKKLKCFLSIAHAGDYAVAVCMLYK